MIPPWVRISGGRYDFDSNTAAFPSIFTGAVSAVGRTGDKVRVSFTSQNTAHSEDAPTRALLSAIRARLRGQANLIWYTDPGYSPRGSFPAAELLTNNTFASGTTGWTSQSNTTISVADRTLRAQRNSVTGNSFSIRQQVTTTQYAPYVLRFFVQPGRGSYASGFTAYDFSASERIGSAATSGFIVGSHVARSTTVTPALLDETLSALLAGDYFHVPYASYARCALVDNGPNLLRRSDELGTSPWSATRASVTANATTAPDGTSTAESIVEDSTAGQTHFISHSSVTVASATGDFSFSAALKAGSRTWCALWLQENTGSTAAVVYFNLSAGSVGVVNTGTNWSNVRGFAASLGNDWYHCTLVARKTNAATSLSGLILIAESNNDGVFDGNGSGNIYAWRATLAQSSVPTRLVQTTTAAQAATAQTGPGYYTKGWPASTNGLLLMDDWVQIGNQLNKVVAPVNSDAAGKAYLQLAYPQRTAPSDNDPVIIHQPFSRFIAMSNEGGYDFRPKFADHQFELVEALTS